LDQREVTWVTQSFRTIEETGQQLWNNPEWRSVISAPEVTPPDLPGLPLVNTPVSYDLTGKVTKEKDGDTFVLKDSAGKSHTIRLHGVDTREKNQPHGRNATKFLKKRIAGEQVGVETHGKGYHGRTIGTVYVDGVNVNTELVCVGHGWWYKRYALTALELTSCEKSARADKLGLWADADPVPPWEWRRR
jgi:endonuclease YncB( thermonuclease family)